ncbi:alpha/beta hydrolase [Comamonas testosteroni]|nr:alpha/beta hydrolase fold domain-containing protein [Comamonas testosteroni]
MPLPFAQAEAYALQVMTWAHELPTAGLDVRLGIPYGSHPLHRYDVFGSENASNAPILVFWHGGGWTNGYRGYVSFMAALVAKLGCILVAPSYRLAPQDKLPAAYEDGLAALRHVHENAGMFGGNSQCIFLAGHSAGGHLAALIALRSADMQKAGIPQQAIRACLPISGIMDLHHPTPEAGSLEQRVYTMVLNTADDDVAMSPIHWSQDSRVPMHLSYGELDSERVQRSNQVLAQQLSQAGTPCSLTVEPGLDHFATHTTLSTPQAAWYQRLKNVLEVNAV